MKNEHKKTALWIALLVLIEQGIKIFISTFMMDARFTIVPGIFAFETTQNVHLGWLWSMLDFMMPLWGAVLISVTTIVFFLLVYRYLKHHAIDAAFSKWTDRMLIFIMAGAICKLLDDIFWGGSLDYIMFFEWFIFDLKDAYLTAIALPIFVYLQIVMDLPYLKLSKAERKAFKKKRSVLTWIKNGMPMA